MQDGGAALRKRHNRTDHESDASIGYHARDDDQKNTLADCSIVSGNSFATSVLPIRVLFKLSQFLSHLWWWCLDSFIALFIRTTEEQDAFDRTVIILNRISVFFKGGFFAISLIVLSPFALVSFIIWLPLQLCRPRSFSYYSTSDDSSERQRLLFSDITPYQQISASKDDCSDSLKRTPKNVATTSFVKKSYVLVTGNVCLMPEFLARLNNVRNSVKRAEKISQLLCGTQPQSSKCQNYANQNAAKLGKLLDTEMLVKTLSQTSVTASSGSKFESESCREDEVISLDSTSESSFQWSVCSKEKAVCETFPKSSDFLCLQEVFDKRAENALIKGLRARYPYILYDVVTPLHHGRVSLLNSGLCIASKYPFLDVKFKAFPDGYREDKYACKGLLMTKIYLGENEEGKADIGYLATTHLQAITHTKASEVRCKQLNLIQRWLEQFKDRTKNKQHRITFDIICGDFNFDQESHFEEGERKCEFRRIYRDPCMNEITGQQRNWVIGTELIAQYIHDNAVNSSKGLQRMLVSELERPRYVASTRPANCTLTKMSDGRRRIDYILYKPCENKRMVVKDYKFITGFATLTDHIPLSMAFCVEDSDC